MSSRILHSKNILITQNYNEKTHLAIDIVGEGHVADFITAYDNGVVVECRKDYKTTDKSGNSYGNYIKIKHNDNLYTLYAHLKYGSIGVNVGDNVARRQVIAYMGATGRATGVHLHFEVRTSSSSSSRINPMPYLQENISPELSNNLKSNEEIVAEVIKGLWGNGNDRKERLTNAGYDYILIQNMVNNSFKTEIKSELNNDNVVEYTVQNGDNLSKIAQKYNTTWQNIYSNNKEIIGDNPNLIRPGQKLKIKL